jgi:hypothetical protein
LGSRISVCSAPPTVVSTAIAATSRVTRLLHRSRSEVGEQTSLVNGRRVRRIRCRHIRISGKSVCKCNRLNSFDPEDVYALCLGDDWASNEFKSILYTKSFFLSFYTCIYIYYGRGFFFFA